MMWPEARRTSGSARGEARGVLLAVVVALTTAAAAVALVVILVNGSAGGSSRSSGSGSVVDGARESGAAVRTTTAPTSAAPGTSSPGSTSAPATPASTPPRRSRAMSHRPAPPLTYVVRRGDNLTVIAKWFHLHGYGGLYERNRAVIGDNPNLIFPGQRITLSSAGMTVGSD